MTLQTALGIAGAIFLFVALVGGGLKAKEVSVPALPRNIRISLGGFGTIFMVAAVALTYSASQTALPREPATTQTPTPTASPTTVQTSTGTATETTTEPPPQPSTTSGVIQVKITNLPAGARVGTCKIVQGTASGVPADETLVVAKHETGRPYYADPIHNFDDPDAVPNWSMKQYFNKADKETFDVVVFRVKTAEILAARAADPSIRDIWSLDSVPLTWGKAVARTTVYVDASVKADC